MSRTAILKSILAGTAATLFASAASAENFNIPAGDLASALDAYSAQTGISLMVSSDAVRGLRTKGAKGDLNANDALSHILSGTGFATRRYSTDSVALIRSGEQQSEVIANTPMQLAQAAPTPRASVETVTVTSSKLGGADVQSIPISITALSQEQLTATQTAGGPDLVKQVPNLTFTKTNFSGYSIQIRGIGTQAISVTTDPAVAVALNDIPFIRNHFFEQEFFDLSQAEVLRGPQGTLYGRNATAGVVNLITAKPTDQFEAMASGDIGNYKNRRFEGMINLPIVDDRLDLRMAGEWTKRDGYSTNALTGNPIDGRNLWSGRATLAWKPSENAAGHPRLGAFPGRRRSYAHRQANLQNGSGSVRSRRCAGACCGRAVGLCGAALFEPGMPSHITLFARCISGAERHHAALLRAARFRRRAGSRDRRGL